MYAERILNACSSLSSCHLETELAGQVNEGKSPWQRKKAEVFSSEWEAAPSLTQTVAGGGSTQVGLFDEGHGQGPLSCRRTDNKARNLSQAQLYLFLCKGSARARAGVRVGGG